MEEKYKKTLKELEDLRALYDKLLLDYKIIDEQLNEANKTIEIYVIEVENYK